MRIKNKKRFLIATLLLAMVIIITMLFAFIGNMKEAELTENEIQVIRQMPVAYFSLLSEKRLEEAYDLLHIEPSYKRLFEALYSDYKKWPRRFENIQVSEPEQINANLYKLNVSFTEVIEEDSHESFESFETFVLHDKDEWVYILNQHNIPKKYMKNVVIVEDEDYISPSDIIE